MTDFIARIKPKRSTVSGEVPAPQDLEVGEIALSTADGILFTKHTDGSIKSISGGGGGGGGGGATLESIGNVEPRVIASPSVSSWSFTGASEAGKWDFNGTTVTLNREDEDGNDLLAYIITLPASGPIWWSNDGSTYTTTTYNGLATNATGQISFTLANDDFAGPPATIYFAWEDPFIDGPSFQDDVLVFDATKSAWIPTNKSDLIDLAAFGNVKSVDPTDAEVPLTFQWNPSDVLDGLPMVWDSAANNFKPGFPTLSVGGVGGGTITTTTVLNTGQMIGPDRFYISNAEAVADGWVDLGLQADDNSWPIDVPVDLVGTSFLGVAMPARIWHSSNGAIHWDATQGGGQPIGSGNMRNDSNGRDFWLSFWSLDSRTVDAFTRDDGSWWTLRFEMHVRYNNGNGLPVEVSFHRDGRVRLVYGDNQGNDITICDLCQGLVSNNQTIVRGFGVTPAEGARGNFTWTGREGAGVGLKLSALLDVKEQQATDGQVLVFNATSGYYEPGTPAAGISSVGELSDVDTFAINDGDVLRWSAADESFVPSEISTRIQDQQDFAPNLAPPGVFAGNTSKSDQLAVTNPGDWWVSSNPVSKTFNWNRVGQSSVMNLLVVGDEVTLEAGGLTETATVSVAPRNSSNGTGAFISLEPSLSQEFRDLPEGTACVLSCARFPGGGPGPLVDGDILQWNNAEKKFKPAQPSQSAPGASDLADLGDVDLATSPPTADQVLSYDAVNESWRPLTPASGDATQAWVEAQGYGSQADITALQAEVLSLQAELATKIDPAPQDGTPYVRQDGQWLGLEGVLAALGYQPGGGGGDPVEPEVPEIVNGGDFTTGAAGSVDLTLGGGDFTTGTAGDGEATVDGGVFTSDPSIPETVSGGDFTSGSGGSADVTASGGDFTTGAAGSEDVTVDGGVFTSDVSIPETVSGGDFTSGIGGGPDISYGGGDFSTGQAGSEDVTLDGGDFAGGGQTAGGGDFTTGGSGGPDVTYGGGDFSTGGSGSGDVNLDGGDFGGPSASGGDFTTGQAGDDNSTYGAGDFSTGTSSGEAVTMDGGDFTAEGGGDFTSGGAGGAAVTFGAGDFTSGESSGAAVELDGGDFSS